MNPILFPARTEQARLEAMKRHPSNWKKVERMAFKPGDRVEWEGVPCTVVPMPTMWEPSDLVAIVSDGDSEVGTVEASSLSMITD